MVILMLGYFKTPPGRRVHTRVMWCIGAAAVLFAVLFLLLYAAIGAKAAAVPGTDAAQRWTAADSVYPFAQLSAYFDSDAAVDLNRIYLNRMEITKSLEQNAVTTPEGAQPFIDAFSGETSVSVTTERASLSVTATVCGGSFFFFHPVSLIDGGYFDEDDVTINAVILDEYAAWQLFGATEVAGMEVTIGGQPFCVTGVSETPTDPVEKAAYGDSPRIYIHYTGMRMVTGYDSATCYEIVIPNPISGFAADLVGSRFGITDKSKNAVLYDFTERFDFEVLAAQTKDYFMRAMKTDSVIPPYWENVARVAENEAIVLAFFGAVTGILALLLLIVFISLWFWMHPIRVRAIYGLIDDQIEAVRMKRWLKKQNASAAVSENGQL